MKKGRRRVLKDGFCARRTRCNLEKDKEKTKETKRGERKIMPRSLGAILLALVRRTSEGKDNVGNGVPVLCRTSL